jgi:cob(I)alamin adenosyltransferase
MKIYTKTGDQGETSLFGGVRVGKDDLRIEAYGTADELNAAIGAARAAGLVDEVDALLYGVQSDLFDVGAELATPDAAARGTDFDRPDRVTVLEQAIDRFEAELSPLKTFILPAGSSQACALHLARTVCRRCERRVCTLLRDDSAAASSITIQYLNRLSDLLFVLARHANHVLSVADVPWKPQPKA